MQIKKKYNVVALIKDQINEIGGERINTLSSTMSMIKTISITLDITGLKVQMLPFT